MKLILTSLVILFSTASFAGDGPGTVCTTDTGHSITVHLEQCPTNTTKLK
ncbi:hypothetical protein VME0621_04835 [Vibrio mediterranei]|nr:hypothetical protein VME0621_04835 [Vibrio mediterranei]